MSLPKPSVPLTGACTVLFDNTLYSFSAAGFESLALEDGAEWKKLPAGHSVEGAVCVGSNPKDPSAAGLFVVGGQSSSPDYPGLQKFTYATRKWQTITPQVPVTQNRTWHSATYINDSDSILIYSGSTDGQPNLSSQTFTVAASEPHSVLAFQSTLSPPGVAPILLPWSDTQAVLIGGNPTNTNVMLFDSSGSWRDSGTTLAEPLPKNTTFVKAALITGDDGSKHLYTFDLTTAPNTVNRTMILNSHGGAIANAAPAVSTASSRRSIKNSGNDIEKRDLTESDWPQYNSTLAPQNTRSAYSIATDSNGLVVMSGGNDDEILCMFNAKENSWKDATAVFGEQKGFSIESTPSSTATPSATSSVTSSVTSSSLSSSLSTSSSLVSSATSTPAATSTNAPVAAATVASDSTAANSGLPATTLLGVVLGTIFGFAILMLCLLFWLKHLRKRQAYIEAGHARRASGLPDEKDFFREDVAKASGGQFRGHVPQESAGSFSSMAILMGKASKPALQRKASNDTRRSSASSIFNKQFKSTIGRPQPQVSPEPDFIPRDDKGVAVAANANEPKTRPPPAAEQGDTRRSSGWNRYWSGGSALSVFGFGNNSNAPHRGVGGSEPSSVYSDKNRMTQDSATVPPLQVVEGRAELNRVNSGSPTVSQYNPRIREGMSGQIEERPVSPVSSAGYSSGIPASVRDTWDPAMAKKAWDNERVPSSTYSQSIYQTALGPPGASRPPTGVSTQPQLAMGANSNDLSWLNLGENSRPPYR